MTPPLNYLAESHHLLADSYQANCLAIARVIARLLLDSGKRSFIMCLSKVEDKREELVFYNSDHRPPVEYASKAVEWLSKYLK